MLTKRGWCLLVAVAYMVFLSLGRIGYGQPVEKGIIGQVIGGSKIEFYVSDVKVTEESGAKIVNVSAMFKNIKNTDVDVYPSIVRLVDSQAREYEPDYFSRESASLPPNDTFTWNGEFKILPTNNPSKIYFVNHYNDDGSESRNTVDLTKSMNPPAPPPKSSWILTPNKGVKLSNGLLEVLINDEKYVGSTYIVDLTIKNLGYQRFTYDASDFKVKDTDGFEYSANKFYNLLSPLLSGDLATNDMVRGDIAFDVKKTSGNMMIILSVGYNGVPFLNTGSLSKK